MDKKEIEKLLNSIAAGEMSVPEGLAELSNLPLIESEFANLDCHRPLRNGFSEVIYGESKSLAQMRDIIKALNDRKMNVFATRVSAEKGLALKAEFKKIVYQEESRTLTLINREVAVRDCRVAICTAGTADYFVAEEASSTLKFFGVEAEKFYDVGVAGLHRLLNKSKDLKKSDVIIVVAGMEGALPSVIGGMFSQPIIAVPTSVGYGLHLKGVAPLIAMLCSCAEGVVVVNVDNGFGAACAALRITNHQNSYTNKNQP